MENKIILLQNGKSKTATPLEVSIELAFVEKCSMANPVK